MEDFIIVFKVVSDFEKFIFIFELVREDGGIFSFPVDHFKAIVLLVAFDFSMTIYVCFCSWMNKIWLCVDF